MAHDLSDRPALFAAGRPGSIDRSTLGWDDPATSPLEVGTGGTHPLFVSGVGRPLEWEPSTPHRLASPLTDGAGEGRLR